MKGRGLLNKQISKNKIPNISIETEKMSIFTFPILSLWKIKVAIATRVFIRPEKNIIYVEANVLSMYAKFQLYPLIVSEKIFKYFSKNYPSCRPGKQPN